MALEVQIKKDCGNFYLDVNFTVDKGILGVLGASGCGKSMTLKCLAGIVTPDEGKIILDGKVLFDSATKINLPPQKRNIGYLFQSYALFPHMSVEENIAVGIKSKDKVEKKGLIEKYLRIFYLEDYRKARPKNLSGGQQQRVALARIFASKPDMLMLDEPFSALDDFLKWQVELELKKILSSYDKKILFVSHNRDEIYRFCDDVVVLNKGKVTAFTTKKSLFEKPQTLSASKLSGCKNHSALEKMDDYTIKAIDWNVILHLKDKVEAVSEFVGIRAHEIKVMQFLEENAFEFVIENIIENIFSVILMVRRFQANSAIRVEINKNIWQKSFCDKKVGDSICIELPSNHLFLLTK